MVDLFNGIQLPVVDDKAFRILFVEVRGNPVPDILDFAICQKDNIIWSAFFLSLLYRPEDS